MGFPPGASWQIAQIPPKQRVPLLVLEHHKHKAQPMDRNHTEAAKINYQPPTLRGQSRDCSQLSSVRGERPPAGTTSTNNLPTEKRPKKKQDAPSPGTAVLPAGPACWEPSHTRALRRGAGIAWTLISPL